MKKFMFLFVSFFVIIAGFVYAVPTDDQIRQAATTLAVPFADLKQFVQSYQTTGSKQKAAPAAEIKIDARKLYEDYKANQLKADKQYKGKTLQITGTVADITQNIMTNEYYLKIAGKSNYETVNVYFQKSELDKITDLDKGQTVTVLGRCEGYNILSVEIKDAYLVR